MCTSISRVSIAPPHISMCRLKFEGRGMLRNPLYELVDKAAVGLSARLLQAESDLLCGSSAPETDGPFSVGTGLLLSPSTSVSVKFFVLGRTFLRSRSVPVSVLSLSPVGESRFVPLRNSPRDYFFCCEVWLQF